MKAPATVRPISIACSLSAYKASCATYSRLFALLTAVQHSSTLTTFHQFIGCRVTLMASVRVLDIFDISRSTSAHSWILSSSTKCALDLPMSFLLPSMMTTIVPWSISNARFNKMAHPEVCMSTHKVWKPLHQQKNQWYDPAIDHFRERSSKHFCILVSQLQYVVKKDLNQHCMQGELYVQPGHEEPLDGATRQGREDHWLKKLQSQYQCYPRILHPKHVCKNGNPL